MLCRHRPSTSSSGPSTFSAHAARCRKVALPSRTSSWLSSIFTTAPSRCCWLGVLIFSTSRDIHVQRGGDANAFMLGSISRPTTRLASLSRPLTEGDAVARADTSGGLPGVDVGAERRLGKSIASRKDAGKQVD